MYSGARSSRAPAGRCIGDALRYARTSEGVVTNPASEQLAPKVWETGRLVSARESRLR